MYRLLSIPDGKAGTKKTLEIMRALARAGAVKQLIRELALKIVEPVRQMDFDSEIIALQRWVQDSIRYVRDVAGVETLQPALDTLRLRQGDCDDQCILLAALLLSIGVKPAFIAVGEGPAHFTHVLCAISKNGLWIPLETIYKVPPGKPELKNFESIMVVSL